jgi:hypothetical protein
MELLLKVFDNREDAVSFATDNNSVAEEFSRVKYRPPEEDGVPGSSKVGKIRFAVIVRR